MCECALGASAVEEIMDQRVGGILDELKAEGVLDNTVVMFFADHGRPMPWGKQWLSVEGLQVPLIICAPKIVEKGVEERLVSLIDLAPSMLKLAGQPVPTWMEGKPILIGDFPARDVLFAARDRCGDAMDRIRAVISRDAWLVRNFNTALSRLNWSGYKEASYPGMSLLRVLNETGGLDTFQARWLQPTRPEIEFYDLKTDALGLHDVSQHPTQLMTLAKMHRELDTWIRSNDDRGADGDPPTEPSMEQIQKDKRLDYQRTWKARIKKDEPTENERLAWWMKIYGLD